MGSKSLEPLQVHCQGPGGAEPDFPNAISNPQQFTSPAAAIATEPVAALDQTLLTSTPKSQAAPVIWGWGKRQHQAASPCQAEGVGFCVIATQTH